MMNKSMLTGVVTGIAVATAGGVAGYALFGQSPALDQQGSIAVIEDVVEAPGLSDEPVTGVPVPSAPVPQQAVVAPRPASQPASRPAPQQVAAVAQPAAQPVVQEECWDEEVTVQVEPKDDKAIAGTAAGAVIGGAVAKKLGDDNDLATAAGAAAGAIFGRRAQRNRQENNTETVIERRCAPIGTR
jgi:uncharacterized protein YcfJ